MDENDVRAYDEAMTMVNRLIPGAMKAFYDKLCKEGFNDDQSLRITIDWFIAIYKHPGKAD